MIRSSHKPINTGRIFKIVAGITITVFVLVACVWIFVISIVIGEVQDNGGVKNSIIKVGKEVKDIQYHIQTDKS